MFNNKECKALTEVVLDLLYFPYISSIDMFIIYNPLLFLVYLLLILNINITSFEMTILIISFTNNY